MQSNVLDIGITSTLKDLSKAFGCISQELITSKLNAYKFSLHALKKKLTILHWGIKEVKGISSTTHGKRRFMECHKILY